MRRWVVVIAVVLVAGLAGSGNALALPGSGTQEDPYRIESLADFDEFAADPNYWSGFSRLETDVNLAGRTYTTAVIAPDTSGSDGFQGTLFTGVFDGNVHKISNLTIDAGTGKDFLGLFGYIGEAGQVNTLGLVRFSVKVLEHGTTQFAVAGLVGSNFGSVSNCYSTGSVSGSLFYNSLSVGGLVGSNGGSISNCYSTGDVNVTGWYVGGLVGGNVGNVSNCYSTGSLRVWGGGLCGSNSGTVTSCFWDIQTSGLTASAAGRGLTTEQMKTLSIFQNAGWGGKGWVMADGVDYPRLAWENTGAPPIPEPGSIPLAGIGTEADPYQINTAEEFASLSWYPVILDKHFCLMADLDLGGLELYPIGYLGEPFAGVFDGNDHIIRNADVNMPGSNHVGLFGYLGTGSEIKNMGAEDISIVGGRYVGGLVGLNYYGSVLNCYSTGDVNGVGSVGGLVGENWGAISNCCSTGDVIGTGWYVGGLVGYNFGSVSNCYSTGDVNGVDDVGGLVGSNWGIVSDCYSTADVNGYSYVGGLVGENGFWERVHLPGYIYNSYSTGSVQGDFSAGGLVGYNQAGEIESSFWDGQTSGEPNMCGEQGEYATGCDPNCGKTTAEMQTKSTFTDAGWDFVDIWLINEGATYPVLRQEIRSDLNGDDSVNMLDLAVFALHWLEEN